MKLIGLVQVALILIAIPICSGMEKDKTPKPVHDVAITDISAPPSCKQGEVVSITITVANQGTRREAFRVTLTEDTSGKEIVSKEMALAKGWADGSEDVADLIFDAEAEQVDYLGGRIFWDPEETGVCNIGSFINAGYINNDEYEDFVYSAPMYADCKGRVYVHYGSKYFDRTPDFVITGNQTDMKLGNGLCLGDLNNDGYDDIIAGASWYKPGITSRP